MKFTLALASVAVGIVAANPAPAAPQPIAGADAVAKRQVDAKYIRAFGDRVRAARAAAVSPTPVSYVQLSKYVDCPAAYESYLYDENVNNYVSEIDGAENVVLCEYANNDDNTKTTCSYNGDTGELNNEVVQICVTQLDPAPETENGACYTGCPSRMGTAYYSSGNINNAQGGIITNCAYSAMEGGQSNMVCQYDTATGKFTQGTTSDCQPSIQITKYCITNAAVAVITN